MCRTILRIGSSHFQLQTGALVFAPTAEPKGMNRLPWPLVHPPFFAQIPMKCRESCGYSGDEQFHTVDYKLNGQSGQDDAEQPADHRATGYSQK
jgi:hypothetical protein